MNFDGRMFAVTVRLVIAALLAMVMWAFLVAGTASAVFNHDALVITYDGSVHLVSDHIAKAAATPALACAERDASIPALPQTPYHG